MELVKYDAACRALAEAKTVDEVKDYRDKAKAIEAYARLANNKTLQADALEITLRAERRLGQLLAESPKATGGQHGGKAALDGSRREPSNKTPTLFEMGIDKKLSARSQKIAKIEDGDFEAIVEAAREKVSTLKNVHVANNSGENEWYTPPEYLESARVVMGSIDLDPASSRAANKTVKATKFYSKKDNGLIKDWRGNVWLNPPYAQPLISNFSEKLINEIISINQAIVLVNNATETNWLQPLLENSDVVCFLKGRVKFIDKDGDPGGAPLQGQVILYFGNRLQSFINEFSKHGVVLRHAL